MCSNSEGLTPSPTPVWELNPESLDLLKAGLQLTVFRIETFQDSGEFAEYTLDELLALFQFRDFESLVKQYKEWHEFGALEWDANRLVHFERMPFSQYMHTIVKSRIREQGVDNTDDSRSVPRFWGQRKTL